MFQETFRTLVAGKRLNEAETYAFFSALLDPSAGVTEAQIGAYLYSTAGRLPSADELVGAARALREQMTHVELTSIPGGQDALDTCGTGGSGLDCFNVSTAGAFIVAACGVIVAKHGNRAASSRCGSADILESLGISLTLSPGQVEECVRRTGFGFFFAPLYHTATKRVGAARRELGVRTIFNFLGPLVNPALVKRQILGVSVREMLLVMAESLGRLGSTRVLLVCSEEGLDEITLTGRTFTAEIEGGTIRSGVLEPEEFGMKRLTMDEQRGFDPGLSAEKLRAIFAGEPGPLREFTLSNAGAALMVAGKAATIRDGIALAAKAIDSGQALAKLDAVIAFSRASV